MRRYLLTLIAAGLLCGCGANDTYSPALIGNGGSFRLSAYPPSNTVFLGNKTTYSITGTSVGSFNSSVSLSASGLPQGAAASFSPTSITPTANGTSSTLTIDTGGVLDGTIRSAKSRGGASRAIFEITITGQGGGVTQQTTVQLDLQNGGG